MTTPLERFYLVGDKNSAARQSTAMPWQQFLRSLGDGPKHAPGSSAALLQQASTAYGNRLNEAQAFGVDADGTRSPSLAERVFEVLEAPGNVVRGFGTGLLGMDVTNDDGEFRGGGLGEAFSRAGQALIGRDFTGGDIEGLKLEGDEGLGERVGKVGTAAAIDIFTDPLNLIGLSSATYGRRAAAEGVEAATRTGLQRGIADVSGDVLEKYATRSLPGRAQHHLEAAVKAGDGDLTEEAVERFTKTAMEGLDPKQLAREGLAGEAAEVYLRSGARGVRQFFLDELGPEAGERLWLSLPRDVRGGIRIRVPFKREKTELLDASGRKAGEFKSPYVYAPGEGGGSLLGRFADNSRAVKAVDDVMAWTDQRMINVRNRARLSKIGDAVTARLGGMEGELYNQVLRDLLTKSPDDLTRVGFQSYAAFTRSKTQSRYLSRALQRESVEAAATYEQILRSAGDGRDKAEQVAQDWFDRGGDAFDDLESAYDEVTRSWDANRLRELGLDVDNLSDADMQGMAAAKIAHDYFAHTLGKLQDLLRGVDGESRVDELDNYLAHVWSEDERNLRILNRPAQAATRSQGAGPAGGYNPTRASEQYWTVDLVEGPRGPRVKPRRLSNKEANELSGRPVFRTNPADVIIQYGEAARKLSSRVRFSNLLREHGVVVKGDIDFHDLIKTRNVAGFATATQELLDHLQRQVDEAGAWADADTTFVSGAADDLRSQKWAADREVQETAREAREAAARRAEGQPDYVTRNYQTVAKEAGEANAAANIARDLKARAQQDVDTFLDEVRRQANRALPAGEEPPLHGPTRSDWPGAPEPDVPGPGAAPDVDPLLEFDRPAREMNTHAFQRVKDPATGDYVDGYVRHVRVPYKKNKIPDDVQAAIDQFAADNNLKVNTFEGFGPGKDVKGTTTVLFTRKPDAPAVGRPHDPVEVRPVADDPRQAVEELADDGNTLYLVTCGKSKADGPMPAGEMYTGGFASDCMRVAKALADSDDNIRILSGKHGLLKLDQVVEPYNEVITKAAADKVAEQAAEEGLHGRRVVVLGGAKYRDVASRVWDDVVSPNQGAGGMGAQKKKLNAIAAEAEPTPSLADTLDDKGLPKFKRKDGEYVNESGWRIEAVETSAHNIEWFAYPPGEREASQVYGTLKAAKKALGDFARGETPKQAPDAGLWGTAELKLRTTGRVMDALVEHFNFTRDDLRGWQGEWTGTLRFRPEHEGALRDSLEQMVADPDLFGLEASDVDNIRRALDPDDLRKFDATPSALRPLDFDYDTHLERKAGRETRAARAAEPAQAPTGDVPDWNTRSLTVTNRIITGSRKNRLVELVLDGKTIDEAREARDYLRAVANGEDVAADTPAREHAADYLTSMGRANREEKASEAAAAIDDMVKGAAPKKSVQEFAGGDGWTEVQPGVREHSSGWRLVQDEDGWWESHRPEDGGFTGVKHSTWERAKEGVEEHLQGGPRAGGALDEFAEPQTAEQIQENLEGLRRATAPHDWELDGLRAFGLPEGTRPGAPVRVTHNDGRVVEGFLDAVEDRTKTDPFAQVEVPEPGRRYRINVTNRDGISGRGWVSDDVASVEVLPDGAVTPEVSSTAKRLAEEQRKKLDDFVEPQAPAIENPLADLPQGRVTVDDLFTAWHDPDVLVTAADGRQGQFTEDALDLLGEVGMPDSFPRTYSRVEDLGDGDVLRRTDAELEHLAELGRRLGLNVEVRQDGVVFDDPRLLGGEDVQRGLSDWATEVLEEFDNGVDGLPALAAAADAEPAPGKGLARLARQDAALQDAEERGALERLAAGDTLPEAPDSPAALDDTRIPGIDNLDPAARVDAIQARLEVEDLDEKLSALDPNDPKTGVLLNEYNLAQDRLYELNPEDPLATKPFGVPEDTRQAPAVADDVVEVSVGMPDELEDTGLTPGQLREAIEGVAVGGDDVPLVLNADRAETVKKWLRDRGLLVNHGTTRYQDNSKKSVQLMQGNMLTGERARELLDVYRALGDPRQLFKGSSPGTIRRTVRELVTYLEPDGLRDLSGDVLTRREAEAVTLLARAAGLKITRTQRGDYFSVVARAPEGHGWRQELIDLSEEFLPEATDRTAELTRHLDEMPVEAKQDLVHQLVNGEWRRASGSSVVAEELKRRLLKAGWEPLDIGVLRNKGKHKGKRLAALRIASELGLLRTSSGNLLHADIDKFFQDALAAGAVSHKSGKVDAAFRKKQDYSGFLKVMAEADAAGELADTWVQNLRAKAADLLKPYMAKRGWSLDDDGMWRPKYLVESNDLDVRWTSTDESIVGSVSQLTRTGSFDEPVDLGEVVSGSKGVRHFIRPRQSYDLLGVYEDPEFGRWVTDSYMAVRVPADYTPRVKTDWYEAADGGKVSVADVEPGSYGRSGANPGDEDPPKPPNLKGLMPARDDTDVVQPVATSVPSEPIGEVVWFAPEGADYAVPLAKTRLDTVESVLGRSESARIVEWRGRDGLKPVVGYGADGEPLALVMPVRTDVADRVLDDVTRGVDGFEYTDLDWGDLDDPRGTSAFAKKGEDGHDDAVGGGPDDFDREAVKRALLDEVPADVLDDEARHALTALIEDALSPLDLRQARHWLAEVYRGQPSEPGDALGAMLADDFLRARFPDLDLADDDVKDLAYRAMRALDRVRPVQTVDTPKPRIFNADEQAALARATAGEGRAAVIHEPAKGQSRVLYPDGTEDVFYTLRDAEKAAKAFDTSKLDEPVEAVQDQDLVRLWRRVHDVEPPAGVKQQLNRMMQGEDTDIRGGAIGDVLEAAGWTKNADGIYERPGSVGIDLEAIAERRGSARASAPSTLDDFADQSPAPAAAPPQEPPPPPPSAGGGGGRVPPGGGDEPPAGGPPPFEGDNPYEGASSLLDQFVARMGHRARQNVQHLKEEMRPVVKEQRQTVRARFKQSEREAKQALKDAKKHRRQVADELYRSQEWQDALSAWNESLRRDAEFVAINRERLAELTKSILDNPTDAEAFEQLDELLDEMQHVWPRMVERYKTDIRNILDEDERSLIKQRRSLAATARRAAESRAKRVTKTRPELDPATKWLVNNGLDQLGATATTTMPVELDVSFAPEVMRKTIDRYFQLQTGDTSEADKWLTETFKALHGLWRVWATLGRGPGYHARNLVGGTWNNFLGDVTVEDSRLAGRLLVDLHQKTAEVENRMAAEIAAKTGYDLERVKADVLSPFEIRRVAREEMEELWNGVHVAQGVTAHDLFDAFEEQLVRFDTRLMEGLADAVKQGDPDVFAFAANQGRTNLFHNTDLGDLSGWQQALNKGADNWWIRANAGAATWSEEFLRLSAFIRGAREYGLHDGGLLAANKVKGLHFDYSSAALSEFERKWLRGSLVPFWVWAKGNVPLQWRSLMAEPGKINRMLVAWNSAADLVGDPDEELLPEWIEERLGFQTRATWQGAPIVMGLDLPLMDTVKFSQSDPRENLLEAASMVTPFVTSPLEALANVDTFTGAPDSDNGVPTPAWARLVPFLNKWQDSRGVERMDEGTVRMLQDLIPPLNQVSKLAGGAFDAATGRDTREAGRLPTNLLSSTLPLGVTAGTFTPEQQAGELRARAEHIERRLRAEVPDYKVHIGYVRELLKAGYPDDQIIRLVQARRKARR